MLPVRPQRGFRARPQALLVCLGAAFTVAGCVTPPPPHAGLRQSVQEELDQVRTRGSLPGITAAVILADGQTEGFASGFADVDQGLSMPPTAVMPAGSVGKQFFASVALALGHEKRIDLDATIDRWFKADAWFERLANAHQLTLRLLLTHRSGLADHRYSEGFRAALIKRFGQQPFDPEFRIPPEELVSFILDAPPLFPAGTDFRYSETGYILAGMALERACQCVYYQELERRFLQPLALRQTRPAIMRAMPDLVPGYIGEALPGFPPKSARDSVMLFNPATEWTGGGLYSSVSDLVRWSKALYEEKAMTPPYLQELLSGSPDKAPPADGYGFGVRSFTTPIGEAYGHAGEFPGYLTFVAYFPQTRMAIALQTNTGASNPEFLKDSAVALMQKVLEHP